MLLNWPVITVADISLYILHSWTLGLLIIKLVAWLYWLSSICQLLWLRLNRIILVQWTCMIDVNKHGSCELTTICQVHSTPRRYLPLINWSLPCLHNYVGWQWKCLVLSLIFVMIATPSLQRNLTHWCKDSLLREMRDRVSTCSPNKNEIEIVIQYKSESKSLSQYGGNNMIHTMV